MIPKFPKPKDVKRKREPIKVFQDGREVLNTQTKAGKEEYKLRLLRAYVNQGGYCSICGKRLDLADATPDHITPRGMGGSTRDDRQSNIAAAHSMCNNEKGSKRIGEADAVSNH